MLNMEKCDDEIIREIRKVHIEYLYVQHKCDGTCKKDKMKKCSLIGQPATPLKPIPVKFLHLMCREKYLNEHIVLLRQYLCDPE